MPVPNPQALAFLQSRRSRPAKTLAAPAPTREQLEPLLMAAARTPDHGKLEPWRFIVIQGGAMPRLAHIAQARGTALDLNPDQIVKGRTQFDPARKVVPTIVGEMLKAGVIARAMPQGDIIGFAPPFCLTREEADKVVGATAEAIKASLG